MNGEILVFVTSVIHYKERRLSYSSKRSVFLPAERLEQTKKTVASIRNKLPSAKIYLFEQGNIDVAADLAPLVDSYSYIGSNRLVRCATDSLFKGLGEAIGLLVASRRLPSDAGRYFKISGRYFLDDNFNPHAWIMKGLTARFYGKYISTRLYSFTGDMFGRWRLSLLLSLPLLLLNRCIELTMPLFMPASKLIDISELGVSGFIAVGGELFSE